MYWDKYLKVMDQYKLWISINWTVDFMQTFQISSNSISENILVIMLKNGFLIEHEIVFHL